MKRIILVSICMFMATMSTFAIDYRGVGGNADFSAYKFEGQYYLILTFKDDNDYRLIDYTVLRIKLKDGTILRLEGTDGSKKTLHYTTFSGHSGGSNDKHFAMFMITPEQIEMLNKGVEGIAINSIPEPYVKTKWTGKDKFGKNLYEDYKKLKDEFEE